MRIHFSNLEIALKYIPNFSKLNAIINAKKITGTPVPMEKEMGNSKVSDEAIFIGKSTPKYKAPLYGQNANANKTPNTKLPSNPLVLNFSVNFSETETPLKKFNLMTFSINNPIKIIKKPMYFSPFPWKNLAI